MKRKVFDKYVGVVEDVLEISKDDIFTKTRKREKVRWEHILIAHHTR